jgi:hypothetical protein
MLRHWLASLFETPAERDPIDHPDLARMSPNELADLPLWPIAEPRPAPKVQPASPSDRPSTLTSVVTELAM